VGLAGIAVLELLKPGALLDLQGWGELAVAAAVSCWALGTVVSRRIDHKLAPVTLTA
jgi:drug/metabolite transporter (DMT)-like permease